MQFLLADVKAAGAVQKEEDLKAFDYLGPPPESVSFNHKIHAKVKAQMATTNVYISGCVSTVLTFSCARCLKDFDKKLNGEFSQVHDFNHQIIDVSQEIKETILVDIPIQALCQKDCKGICSSCGKNLNFDSCKCKGSEGDSRLQTLKNYPFKK